MRGREFVSPGDRNSEREQRRQEQELADDERAQHPGAEGRQPPRVHLRHGPDTHAEGPRERRRGRVVVMVARISTARKTQVPSVRISGLRYPTAIVARMVSVATAT